MKTTLRRWRQAMRRILWPRRRIPPRAWRALRRMFKKNYKYNRIKGQPFIDELRCASVYFRTSPVWAESPWDHGY